MKQYALRLTRLFVGLFFYALGIALTLKADIGYAPWEVFHVGLSNVTGLSIGTISIIVGLLIVGLTLLLGEKLGLGTLANMVFIGMFLDLILWTNLLPKAPNLAVGIALLVTGLFSIALGTFFYVGSAFGAGPRDSLMVALTRKTRLPVGVCRAIIELCVLVAGWLLGGMVGVGTLISVVAIGFCVQITFKLFRFDPTAVRHETLRGTWDNMTRSARKA